MNRLILLAGFLAWSAGPVCAGSFAPAAGQAGSTAIASDSPLIHGWATGVVELTRGPVDITVPAGALATYGTGADALGAAVLPGGSTFPVVSLGDGGHITLSFAAPIRDGAGADFAVFENSFDDVFLELAFVEVSSDGTHWVMFPSFSETQTTTQIGGFGTLNATNIDGLAGKYRLGYGTPFDLSVLIGVSPFLDLNSVQYVRLTDVVGSINPLYGTKDSLNRYINDPFKTNFTTGGFDLDAVGVINQVPEPAAGLLAVLGLAGGLLHRRRRSSSGP